MGLSELLLEFNIDIENELIQLALTDKSYKNVLQEKFKQVSVIETNDRLATLGDGVLKAVQTFYLYKNETRYITNIRQSIESDKFLVGIAEKLDLLRYLKCNQSDGQRKNDYHTKNTYFYTFDTSQKYIATAVEALIGAVFLVSNNSFEIIYDFVKRIGCLNVIDNEQ